MTFKSMADLKAYILTCAAAAVQITNEQVRQAMLAALSNYYGEFHPKVYDRTYAFMSSLETVGVEISGDAVTAKTRISPSYLGMMYGGNYPNSGLDVALAAEKGLHGAGPWSVPGGTPFWTYGLQSLGGEAGIYALLKANLAAMLPGH